MREMIFPAVAMCIVALSVNAAPPDLPAQEQLEVPPSIILATIPDSTGEIQFEQFDDGIVVMTERRLNAASRLSALEQLAKSEGIRLCPAQVFGMFSTAPIPEALFARCADQKRVRADLDKLRISAKYFYFFDVDVVSRPLLCNGLIDEATAFRTNECDAEESDLLHDSHFDTDNVFWCASNLRTSSDRIMSQMLNDEGEVASTRMVSCGGRTRFRFYRRDSTDDAWNLYRDYDIGANEYFTLYGFDHDDFGDSDFRFRMTSDRGAGHRNTGYFIDD
jgi:hypothetical protein